MLVYGKVGIFACQEAATGIRQLGGEIGELDPMVIRRPIHLQLVSGFDWNYEFQQDAYNAEPCCDN